MLTAILRPLKNLDLILAGICLVLLLCATALGVVMRYAVNSPLTWLEEAQMLFITLLVFFGGSATFRFHAHVSIEILVDTMPAWAKKAVEVLIFLVVTAVLVFIAYRGYDYVARLAAGKRVSNVLRIPYALTYAALPVGAACMLVNFWIAEIKRFVFARRDVAQNGEGEA
ncbi:MAG: TRAP transporter small permease [Planctomycetaceae bacterium]|nr:TRAP transporter small permease [Planctomycetaceae bacterium]